MSSGGKYDGAEYDGRFVLGPQDLINQMSKRLEDEAKSGKSYEDLEEVRKHLESLPDYKAINKEVISILENKPVGVKLDSGKTRWELLTEMDSAEETAKVLTYGGNTKYSRGNYLHVIGWRWRYVGAAMRHIRAYLKARRLGNKELELDPDTGYHHIAHAIASLLMLLDNEMNNRPEGDTEPEKKK